MNLALLQYAPRYLEVARNLDQVEILLEKADVDLVVLPELFATGYFFKSQHDLARVAEPVPGGSTTQRLLGWARTSGATFVAGLAEVEEDRFYNSAVVVGPEGDVGVYRKVHLFYEEKLYFTPGDVGFPSFDVKSRAGDVYRLGVMICFDWYFPEAARSLALGGADVIAHPSNLVRKDCPRSMPIRALENHVFTATANRIGQESNGQETLTFIGQSLICSPEGDVLAQAGREEAGLLRATFDPAAARDRQITAHNHLLADRRPEAYRVAG